MKRQRSKCIKSRNDILIYWLIYIIKDKYTINCILIKISQSLKDTQSFPTNIWGLRLLIFGGFPGGSAMQETWVQSLGWEDPLEKEKATHSSILAWRIPWT